MNKLNVAIKLLQLLNDRKFIDTKIVACELNVSLRTAQRYLLELSTLPCVLFDDKNRSYSLDVSYKMNEVLINGTDKKIDSVNSSINETPVNGTNKKISTFNGLNVNISSFNKMMCLVCRNNKTSPYKAPSPCQNNNTLSNNHLMNKIVSIIKKSCVYH